MKNLSQFIQLYLERNHHILRDKITKTINKNGILFSASHMRPSKPPLTNRKILNCVAKSKSFQNLQKMRNSIIFGRLKKIKNINDNKKGMLLYVWIAFLFLACRFNELSCLLLFSFFVCFLIPQLDFYSAWCKNNVQMGSFLIYFNEKWDFLSFTSNFIKIKKISMSSLIWLGKLPKVWISFYIFKYLLGISFN